MATPFTLKGLTFESSLEFDLLMSINDNADLYIKLAKEGLLSLRDYFNCFSKIDVEEVEYNSVVDLEYIFPNIRRLILLDNHDKYPIEYNFCDYFYNLMRIKYF